MAQADDLKTMVAANDKLLKAIISLLAVKDEHLMEELETIFLIASQSGSIVGDANAPTWAHIRRELDAIGDLAEATHEMEAAAVRQVS